MSFDLRFRSLNHLPHVCSRANTTFCTFSLCNERVAMWYLVEAYKSTLLIALLTRLCYCTDALKHVHLRSSHLRDCSVRLGCLSPIVQAQYTAQVPHHVFRYQNYGSRPLSLLAFREGNCSRRIMGSNHWFPSHTSCGIHHPRIPRVAPNDGILRLQSRLFRRRL
jgi:hypothetical protein